MSVHWGLIEVAICGLMNAAPWPPSAGAFNASVRAGLLSSKTLAKADFFTGNLCLRTFRRRLCACGAGDWISTSCCTFSSQMQPTLQPVLQIYIRSCVSTHTASVQATTLCPGTARCRASQTHTHTCTASTHMTSHCRAGCQDLPTGPHATCNS